MIQSLLFKERVFVLNKINCHKIIVSYTYFHYSNIVTIYFKKELLNCRQQKSAANEKKAAPHTSVFTFVSVVLGYATTVIPRWLTYYVAVGLFLVFGIKMLHEGISMSAEGSQDELEEVQEELNKQDEKVSFNRKYLLVDHV